MIEFHYAVKFRDTHRDFNRWRSIYGHSYYDEWMSVRDEVIKSGSYYPNWLRGKYRDWLRENPKEADI